MMMAVTDGAELVEALLQPVDPDVAATLRADPALPDHVTALVERARAAWPGLTFDATAWLEHLGTHLRADAGTIAALHAGDLLLAWAAATGLPDAVEAFEAHYGAEIDRGLRRLDPEALDDLRQWVRERLCVGAVGTRPRLAEYGGRGPLLHWLRVAVVRMRTDALRQAKREPRHAALTGGELAAAASDDPELAYLRAHYGELLKQAFAKAVDELDAEQRILLRQHVIAGLGSGQIAGLHGVHPATAKRWLARAREDLWRATRREVMVALGLSRHQFESIVRLVSSELDLSVARLLEPSTV